MIPIKEGHLPYPHLEIKPTPAPKAPGSSNNNAEDSAVTCETDYKNSGETIRVVSNLRKATVSLDAAGPGGGAWLFDSEKRETEMGVFVV